MPESEYEERKCGCTYLPSIADLEFPTFQRRLLCSMQIVCDVRGWMGKVGSHEVA